MELYSKKDNYILYKGNMLNMLEVISPNSIDSIITDPPYELNFMNRSWDCSGIAFNKEAWEKCYKVLKPGGFLLAFGGSRTFHRIACAIEDAGFMIKDTIMYLYGSGFPKGLNIGLAVDRRNGVESEIVKYEDTPNFKDVANKQKELGNGSHLTFGQIENADRLQYARKQAKNEWNGWNTQLKPAYEPVIVAQKPVEISIIDNIMKWGVGAYNIDECRIELEKSYELKTTKRQSLKDDGVFNNNNCGLKPENSFMASANPNGRYPSNVIHDGSEEVVKNMPLSSSKSSDYNFEMADQDNPTHLYTNIKSGKHFEDEGSAARYFYCAKASAKDRDEGLDDFEAKKVHTEEGGGTRKEDGKSIIENPNLVRKNIHPTVKPTELMQYLVRLVSPKGATILDCFNGSGSTGKAVMFENKERNADYKYIGIELTEEYLPIAKARIEYVINNDFYFYKDESGKTQHEKIDKNIKTLFDFIDD